MSRILFINPNTRHLGALLTVYPPMGVLYLASVLREEGHGVRLVDADMDALNSSEVLRAISDYEPKVVGITMNSLQARPAYEIADLIRAENPGAKIVVGGPHPSALREKILKKSRSIDAVVYGEGEATFSELARAFDEERDLEHIKGICFRDGDEIVANEPRDLIADLDSIPMPALDLAEPIRRYPGAYPVGGRSSIQVMASRGCPFNCTFCSNPVWRNKVRFRSPESILAEVEMLAESFKVGEVFFQDDTFNLKRDWFEAICSGIIERGLNKRLVFKSPFRANERLLDQDLLRLAKEAGFWMIFYGVESGNQDILNSVKKNLKLEEIERAFRLTKRAGIRTYASFMVGNLGESRRTVADTIRFAKKIDPDYYGFAIATPYPGSEFYDRAVEKRYIDPEFDGFDLNRYALWTESFSPGEAEELVRWARQSMEDMRSSRIHSLKIRFRGGPSALTPVGDHFPAMKPPREDLLDEEIVMGESDWDVLGPGWYDLENWPPKVRWTGKMATAYLRRGEKSKEICVKAMTSFQGLVVWISANDERMGEDRLDPSKWTVLRAPLPDIGDDSPLKVGIEVLETWVPEVVAGNDDRRELGLAVERSWVE